MQYLNSCIFKFHPIQLSRAWYVACACAEVLQSTRYSTCMCNLLEVQALPHVKPEPWCQNMCPLLCGPACDCVLTFASTRSQCWPQYQRLNFTRLAAVHSLCVLLCTLIVYCLCILACFFRKCKLCCSVLLKLGLPLSHTSALRLKQFAQLPNCTEIFTVRKKGIKDHAESM